MIINDASVTHSTFCTMVHGLESATSASFSVSHRFDTSNFLYQTLATVMDSDGQRWTACDGDRKRPTYCNGWLACDSSEQLWLFVRKPPDRHQ